VIVVSAVLVLSCGQTDRHTDTEADADKRFTPATFVGVNNNHAFAALQLIMYSLNSLCYCRNRQNVGLRRHAAATCISVHSVANRYRSINYICYNVIHILNTFSLFQLELETISVIFHLPMQRFRNPAETNC